MAGSEYRQQQPDRDDSERQDAPQEASWPATFAPYSKVVLWHDLQAYRNTDHANIVQARILI